MADWNLHYPQWMIGDGTPDLSVEEVFEWFAVEFWSVDPLVKTSSGQRSADPVQDYRYEVRAEVIYVTEKAVVIDFGLVTTGPRDRVPVNINVGEFVSGVISVGVPLCIDVDPKDVPGGLGYSWRINQITADLTPYVPQEENSRYFVRDVSRLTYRQVNSTMRVEAHDYVLHCTEIRRF